MTRPKTIICDIDGTLIEHSGPLHISINKPVILEGVLEKFREWDKKDYDIILLTSRRESTRKLTEECLQSLGIFYDKLIMGVVGGQRVLINDLKPNKNNPTAIAINLERNKGILNIEI